LRLCLVEHVDGDSLLLMCGIKFPTAGAAKLNVLQPTALVVRGMCED